MALHAGSNASVLNSAVLIDVNDGTTDVTDADTLSFGPGDFDVTDGGGGDASVALAATITSAHTWTGTQQFAKVGIGAAAAAAEILSLTASGSIASGASAVWDGANVKAATATITGSTNITTATGFNLISIAAPTLSAASALTVTNAATVYIAGPPAGAGAGPATITNPYSLWVDAGAVRIDGQILGGDGTASAPTYSFSGSTTGGIYRVAANKFGLSSGSGGTAMWDGSGFHITNTYVLGFASGAINTADDIVLVREAAAILQMGADVNGAAIAQTFKAHDGITGTDIAGANLILAGGRGTGAGAVGNLIFQTSTVLGTGTTAQTLATRVTISGTTITATLPIKLSTIGSYFIADTTVGYRFNNAADTANLLIISDAGLFTIVEAGNFAFGTVTGTKIGTATTQKIGFWNATPVVQGAAVADASGGAVIDAEARTALNTLLARMRTYGLIAT